VWEKFGWADLAPQFRQHWEVLGWNHYNWDGNVEPSSSAAAASSSSAASSSHRTAAPPAATEALKWGQLTRAQQVSAAALGYSPQMWDAHEDPQVLPPLPAPPQLSAQPPPLAMGQGTTYAPIAAQMPLPGPMAGPPTISLAAGAVQGEGWPSLSVECYMSACTNCLRQSVEAVCILAVWVMPTGYVY